MKILLAGTPNFSVPIFKKIIDHYEVVGIITQPDRKSGRGLQLISSPVKTLALKNKIKVFQSNKISEIYDELKVLEFDIFLTVAFGQLIPNNILSLAKIGSINLHGSLLPKYRGAAPIQHAILNGETESGLSLIYMINKMDAGDIIFTEKISIEESDSSDDLFLKFSLIAENIIIDWLDRFINHNFQAIKQDERQVTFAHKLLKEDAFLKIDTSKNMINKIRAFNSNPGAFLFINNQRVKIFQASLIENKNCLKITSSDGFIYINKYQFEGKKIIEIK